MINKHTAATKYKQGSVKTSDSTYISRAGFNQRSVKKVLNDELENKLQLHWKNNVHKNKFTDEGRSLKRLFFLL